MIYSQQIQIIKSMYISFTQNQITHISYSKLSDTELAKYKMFLNPEKYSSIPTDDFKTIILFQLLEKDFTSITNFMKHLQELSSKDIQKIQLNKDVIIAYKNTIKKDKDVISQYSNDPNVIINLYNKNKISILGVYKMLKDTNISRYQTKIFRKAQAFMLFFPEIEDFLRLQ